jgi:hypothetical protein
MMQDHLLDPFLIGNKDNLVNGDNPWGKYVSSDPNKNKEVLASYWYSKTYDEYITDPDTQFLQDSKECRPHKLYWRTILTFSTAPQEVSQGTFECMVCAGIPTRPGVWFVGKEEAVLSQIPY